jgi:hypothetical protein
MGKLIPSSFQFKETDLGIEIDLTNEPNGIYFLKTDTGVWKIIKQ